MSADPFHMCLLAGLIACLLAERYVSPKHVCFQFVPQKMNNQIARWIPVCQPGLTNISRYTNSPQVFPARSARQHRPSVPGHTQPSGRAKGDLLRAALGPQRSVWPRRSAAQTPKAHPTRCVKRCKPYRHKTVVPMVGPAKPQK